MSVAMSARKPSRSGAEKVNTSESVSNRPTYSSLVKCSVFRIRSRSTRLKAGQSSMSLYIGATSSAVDGRQSGLVLSPSSGSKFRCREKTRCSLRRYAEDRPQPVATRPLGCALTWPPGRSVQASETRSRTGPRQSVLVAGSMSRMQRQSAFCHSAFRCEGVCAMMG